MRQKMVEFLKAEGAVATLEASRGEHGTLFVGSGGSRDPEKEMPLPGIVLAIEHYNRIKRLLKSEVPVKIELEFQARYHQEDLNGYNVVAEIPGNDPKLADELVMLGAHIDSWHAGTGATDNAAGVAVTMEAARIIQALDLTPRRTIRMGLWSGNVVRPAFPDVSFKEEVTGVVVAWIETDEQGEVVSVTILQSPNKEMGSAVKKALASWRFAPTTLKGKPVPVAGKLTFYYEIENGVGLVLSPEESAHFARTDPSSSNSMAQFTAVTITEVDLAAVNLPDQHALHRDIGDRRECLARLRGLLEGLAPRLDTSKQARLTAPAIGPNPPDPGSPGWSTSPSRVPEPTQPPRCPESGWRPARASQDASHLPGPRIAKNGHWSVGFLVQRDRSTGAGERDAGQAVGPSELHR